MSLRLRSSRLNSQTGRRACTGARFKADSGRSQAYSEGHTSYLIETRDPSPLLPLWDCFCLALVYLHMLAGPLLVLSAWCCLACGLISCGVVCFDAFYLILGQSCTIMSCIISSCNHPNQHTPTAEKLLPATMKLHHGKVRELEPAAITQH